MKAFTFERTTTYPPIHLSKNKTQPLVLTSKDLQSHCSLYDLSLLSRKYVTNLLSLLF